MQRQVQVCVSAPVTEYLRASMQTCHFSQRYAQAQILFR